MYRGANNFHWFIMIQFSVQDILNFIASQQKLRNPHTCPFSFACINKKTFFSVNPLLLQLHSPQISCQKQFCIYLQSFFLEFKLIIKLRKMEEFVAEDHIYRKEIIEHSQDPFIVVHGFRHLIAKQRRKALRKANKQRKQMLIPSPSLADTFYEDQKCHQKDNQLGESFWDVFNVGESKKIQYQLSSAELLVQSNQISHQGECSSQKSDNTTSMSKSSTRGLKIFAEEFAAFCYSEC